MPYNLLSRLQRGRLPVLGRQVSVMRWCAFGLVVALLVTARLPADAGGSIDLSSSLSTLSSPSNAYGPWVYENLDIQLPPSGRTGIHFENRRASDRFNPTTEQLFVLDHYLRFTRSVSAYAAAEF